MAANSEVVRGRDPVRLPAWVVIGVTLALAGALAVLSIFERDTATPPPSDPVGITQEVSGNARTVETAELKAAVAQRFWAEQHGTSAISQKGSTGTRTDIEMAELKAALAQRFWAEQRAAQESATAHPEISYTAHNGAPVVIDGELCGQCR